MVDNYVIETTEGYGMIVDSSTCHLELNQLKKNALGGLMITTSVRMGSDLKPIFNPPSVEGYDTARSLGGDNGQHSPVFFAE